MFLGSCFSRSILSPQVLPSWLAQVLPRSALVCLFTIRPSPPPPSTHGLSLGPSFPSRFFLRELEPPREAINVVRFYLFFLVDLEPPGSFLLVGSGPAPVGSGVLIHHTPQPSPPPPSTHGVPLGPSFPPRFFLRERVGAPPEGRYVFGSCSFPRSVLSPQVLPSWLAQVLPRSAPVCVFATRPGPSSSCTPCTRAGFESPRSSWVSSPFSTLLRFSFNIVPLVVERRSSSC